MTDDLRRVRHLGRLGAAGCMLLSPVLLVIGTTYHQRVVGDQTEQFAIAAGDAGRWTASHAFIVTAVLLLLGAMLALAYMLRERAPLVALGGSALVILGLSTDVGYIALHGFTEGQAALGDPAEGAALMERIFGSPGVMVFFVALPVTAIGGIALLALTAYRERLVPAWMAAGIFAGPAISGLGATALLGSTLFFVGGSVILLLTLPPLGLRVLAWSDEQFTHPQAGAAPRLAGVAQARGA